MDKMGLKMRELVQKYGLEILRDNKKLNALLADLFPKEKKLRNAIRDALDAGVGRMFYELAKSTGNDDSERLASIHKKLVDEAWLSDAAADNVCRIFLTAIGKSVDVNGNADAFEQKDAQKRFTEQPQSEPAYTQQQSEYMDTFDSPTATETDSGESDNHEKDSRMIPKMSKEEMIAVFFWLFFVGSMILVGCLVN